MSKSSSPGRYTNYVCLLPYFRAYFIITLLTTCFQGEDGNNNNIGTLHTVCISYIVLKIMKKKK